MPHFRMLGIVVALCALAAGCGAAAESAPPQEVAQKNVSSTLPTTTQAGPTATVPAKPYTVEELAAAVGCTPEFQGKPLDFRQAVCEGGGRKFVLLDFATAQGQSDWLDYSLMYGGVYLVGERWVLSADSRDYMVELSKTLGGTIKESKGMNDPNGG